MLNPVNHSVADVQSEHFLVETSAGIQFYMDAWDEQEPKASTMQQEPSQCPSMD